MKRFMCKFDESLGLHKFGAPNYIRGEDFDALKLFYRFEIIGKQVGTDEQATYLEQAVTDDGGWVAFICGLPEQTRLMAFTLMSVYRQENASVKWHHVTGSTWDYMLDSKKREADPHLVVLDSMLTHPPMHPNASRGYDPKRLGKIFDITAQLRGKTSIVILCPDLEPEEAYRISQIQPELMFYLKQKPKDIEL